MTEFIDILIKLNYDSVVSPMYGTKDKTTRVTLSGVVIRLVTRGHERGRLTYSRPR